MFTSKPQDQFSSRKVFNETVGHIFLLKMHHWAEVYYTEA